MNITHTVKFDDVIGVGPALSTMQDLVHQLHHPEAYQAAGGRMPRGCLLYGPPGTGKTLMARAVAGEADASFKPIAGSQLLKAFRGGGAAAVRELFAEAAAETPCVVFIDEIDAIGGARGAAGSDQERESTLNEILVEMDGFMQHRNVVLIAATNLPEKLDPALLQRFEHKVNVTLPLIQERLQMLELHSQRMTLDDDVDLTQLAKKTVGMAGRELEAMLTVAANKAARRDETTTTAEDINEAYWTVRVGPLNQSMNMDPETLERTAYHEAGHAICALLMPESDPVHDITVMPRGPALGVTLTVPDEDRVLYTYPNLLAQLVKAHGGRAAEVLWKGEDYVSTGPSNDMEQIADLAEKMVRKFGMGGLSVRARKSASETRVPESEQTQKVVDGAVERLALETETQAIQILRKHRKLLDEVAMQLIEKEALSNQDFLDIVERIEGTRTPAQATLPAKLKLSSMRGGDRGVA